MKTTLAGEEWYGIDNHKIAVRPGQFLVLNNDQSYSCQIHPGKGARVLSVFFEKDFAAAVFHDMMFNEERLLEGGGWDVGVPEFFQTLHPVDEQLGRRLVDLVGQLEIDGYDRSHTDEHLVFLLRHLVITHKKETRLKDQVSAIKASTKSEIHQTIQNGFYANTPSIPGWYPSAARCKEIEDLGCSCERAGLALRV
jgi:AraC family transcriptional regulator